MSADQGDRAKKRPKFGSLAPAESSVSDEAVEPVAESSKSRLERLAGGGVTGDEREALVPSVAQSATDRLTNQNPNARRLQELEKELTGLRRLLSTSHRMSSALGQSTLLDTILGEVIPLADAHRGLILLADGSELQVVHGRNKDGSPLSLDLKSFSLTLARRCLEANRLIDFDNLSEREDLAEVRSIRVNDLLSAVCLPLVDKDVPFGVLYLDSPRIAVLPTDGEKRLLEAFASQLSVCLINARLIQKLEESQTVLKRENYDLRAAVKGANSFAGMIGSSPPMQNLFHRLNLVKDVNAPVLLHGESGTGKELVARALHSEGPRSDRPFVAVNCGAIPGDLLESELFGHKKGAFTGAINDQPGLVEQAHMGTLFLDEIGDMPLKSQVSILRFLELGEYRRVGGSEVQHADVRLISASNKDLNVGIEENWFREDLFFRLNVVRLDLPPLRERPEDVPLLIDNFFHKVLETFPREIKGITSGALEMLLAYHWPGNVRQLIHVIQGSCALVPDGEYLSETQLLLQLPGLESAISSRPTRPSGPPRLLQDAVAGAERECIAAALERHKWNITKSAQELGISRQHLHSRVRFHGLERPRG